MQSKELNQIYIVAILFVLFGVIGAVCTAVGISGKIDTLVVALGLIMMLLGTVIAQTATSRIFYELESKKVTPK